MSSLEIGKLDVGTSETHFRDGGIPYKGWSWGKCNIDGGIGVKHKIYNSSDKSMKYVTFVYVPYNQVGDVVTSETSGKSEVSAELTGPLDPN